MYQDNSCNSGSRRGSAAATTTAAAAGEGSETTAAAAATKADNFEALTIITTTTTTITTTADAQTTTTVITTAAAATAIATTTATPTAAAIGNNSDDDDGDEDNDIYADAAADVTDIVEIIDVIDADEGESKLDIDYCCRRAHLPNSNSSNSCCGHVAQQLNADVRLLREIGYIASRVRCLGKYYGNFHLTNPYSVQRQRRQLQEIVLRHSIFDPGRERERAQLLAAAAAAVVGGAGATAAAAAAGPAAATTTTTTTVAVLSRSNSFEPDLDRDRDDELEEDIEALIGGAIATGKQTTTATATATATATTTVRRKSSSSTVSAASTSASTSSCTTASVLTAATPIALLEELLIQFYEEHESEHEHEQAKQLDQDPDPDPEKQRNKLTVIRCRRIGGRNDQQQQQQQQQHPQQQHQQHNLNNLNNNNLNNNSSINTNSNSNSNSNNNSHSQITHHSNISNSSNSSILSNGHSLTMSTSMSNMMEAATANAAAAAAVAAATAAADIASSSNTSQQQQQTRSYLHATAAQQQHTDTDNPRRRRASDCTSNQLHCITLKNNNCAALAATAGGKMHRGSCGASGEHLLAANSIANRSTIILSKSCSNVDGDVGAAIGAGLLTANLSNNKLRASATDIESNSLNGTINSNREANATATATTTAIANANTTNANTDSAAAAAASNNGNNEYSILQLNNTIIQCHFNDDDFRALVKDLKRKVEYTERMNWLCLSNRPLGPPHRKSSLPKHQEVKRRFLEICDTNFSDEVKAALRLPAFDSYEWGDADVIHLMQTMFLELGFVEKFSMPIDTLREWLYEVYKHYNEVPFHNFRHCFCVAQMMYAITREANLLNRLGDLECLILLVSCICHDLDHPGYNNIYQINARTELALRYNDISPLENHHCSIAFRLLEHPDCNIFKNFNRETFNNIREGIIRCILATDMARHNEILTQFIEITPIFDYNNRAHINLLCMILIKVADISNEARPMDVAEPWLDRLLQEFFAQSAAEKSEGLPVTPFMDPDKVSKPGSQVRFIGLVLLPLFEALGELVPELTELIIIPVRIALEYYRRLNDAQTKTRKSVADSNASATSDSNSGNMDSNAAMSTPGNSNADKMDKQPNGQTQGGGGAMGGTGGGGGGGGGASGSPQMPRSGSGISAKSRRSIPSQKSASRTSVDEPGGMAAELHDLPEGSESGDSETATEVDVAEMTSKFKVDTEGCSNRSKSSHSNSRKSSREKRPSMIGELCSSGGGQRMRNSYGNIGQHGYHAQRGHFGSHRAVSLDQYSSNNRRLSDGLPQVISDSNVFYGTASQAQAAGDLNMNMNQQPAPVVQQPQLQPQQSQLLLHLAAATTASATAATTAAAATAATSNGNISPTTLNQTSNGSETTSSTIIAADTQQQQQQQQEEQQLPTGGNSSSSTSWKSRLRQFSDYFSFSFDKNNKRFGSTRSSSSCGTRGGGGNKHADADADATSTAAADATAVGTAGTAAICCSNISNSLPSSGVVQVLQVGVPSSGGGGGLGGRHSAYSLDVPSNRHTYRYSSGDSSSRCGNISNISNNTLHSSSGGIVAVRIGSTEEGVGSVTTATIATATAAAAIADGLAAAAAAAAAAHPPPSALMVPSVSCELGLGSVSSSEAVPKI